MTSEDTYTLKECDREAFYQKTPLPGHRQHIGSALPVEVEAKKLLLGKPNANLHEWNKLTCYPNQLRYLADRRLSISKKRCNLINYRAQLPARKEASFLTFLPYLKRHRCRTFRGKHTPCLRKGKIYTK